jgi:hypothetical protein
MSTLAHIKKYSLSSTVEPAVWVFCVLSASSQLAFLMTVSVFLLGTASLLASINTSRPDKLWLSFTTFKLPTIFLFSLGVISFICFLNLVTQDTLFESLDVRSKQTALSIFVFGSLIFRVGIRFAKNSMGAIQRKVEKVIFSNETEISLIKLTWLSILFYFIGSYIAIKTGSFGYLKTRESIYNANSLSLVSSVMLSSNLIAVWSSTKLFRAKRTPPRAVLLFCVLITVLLVGAIRGMREDVLYPLLVFLIASLQGVSKYRLKIFSSLLCLIIVTIGITSWTTNYRETINLAGLRLDSSLSFTKILESINVKDQSSSESVELLLLRRLNSLDYISVIVNPAAMGQDKSVSRFAESLIITVVPRFLWPDKPVISPGRDIAIYYRGLSTDIYTSDGVTPMGDAFRLGGWPAILIFMIFYAFVISWSSGFKGMITPPILSFSLFGYLRWDTSATYFTAGIIQNLLFAIVICMLSRKKSPKVRADRNFEETHTIHNRI